jgi:hypothetical protein
VVQQGVQCFEHGFHAVAGEECDRGSGQSYRGAADAGDLGRPG